MNIEELYGIYNRYPSVKTDSRTIQPGDLFFALKGDHFNGNQYARQALEAGAAYCVCDEITDIKSDRIIFTDNVLKSLQELAKFHRQQFTIPFIAITGSNGKTTTKELVHAVLSKKFRCYTTQGNFNNHIGIPLTILGIKKDAEIAVIEMGANHLHEIEQYCTYTLPTYGIITNCGKAHLEGFGSEAGVRKGKGELYRYIENTGGTVFNNTDYDYLAEMSNAIENKITYGTSGAQYTGEVMNSSALLEVKMTNGAAIPYIRTKLAGNYNLPNILAAVCIGKTFGVSDEQIKDGLEAYTPSNNRSQIIFSGTNTILLDAYNANPSSMKAAIENFAAMEGEKKAVILGGMLELGEDSIKEHAALISLLQQYHWEKVAVAGKDFRDLPENITAFDSSTELSKWFREQDFENTLILVKGSRGMAMEKLIA
ncbi:MAG: UDP-N-acetylmuramoyl-tripeptide--D-alanyl-D-alanine ligase [Ferruginibacter sp.]